MTATTREAPLRADSNGSREQSDAKLIRKFRSGDESAAAILFERYSARLRALAQSRCHTRFAGRFDADDIVQAVFRGFFSGVLKETYHAPNEGELWGLLMVLTFNEIRHQIEYHEAAKRSVHRTIHSADFKTCPTAVGSDAPTDLLELLLEDLLSGQPLENREIIQFRVEGYDVKEIACLTGRSLRTVERVLHDFRSRVAHSS